MPDKVSLLIIIIFTFGTSIFYFLSMLERSVIRLVFNQNDRNIKNDDIDFVHQSIIRLIPVLPPTFGVVMFFGSLLLVYQGILMSWSYFPILIIAYYWLILIYLIFVRKNPITVKKIQTTKSSATNDLKRGNLKMIIIDHHLGLIANLGVLLMELFLIIFR